MKTHICLLAALFALLAAGLATASTGGRWDITASSFPAMSSVAPRGSLVYAAATVSRISTAGEVEEFTLTLDTGQTLTVVMSPESSGLHADVEVLAPDSTVLGSATGSGAGLDAVIQTVPVAAAGTYMIRASGWNGTVGNYSLRGILNAAVEEENHDGPANDSQVTAQNLDGSSLGLGGNATRLAALGAMPGAGYASDWYSFSATAGQVLGIHLAQLTAGNVTVDMFDGSGSWLSRAMPDGNSGYAIARLQAPDTGLYSVRVTGSDASYNLVIVRDIVFDTEPNEPPAEAQEEWPAGMALGAVETAGARDGYRVSANAGDLLVAYTDTPSGGSGEFDNALDPVIELYDPADELLDNDDNSRPDGRNAYLTYTVPVAGEYTLHVIGANNSDGEYVLSFFGATGPPEPLYVETIAPTDTAVLLTYPAEILVEFNDFILLTSVTPSDLTVEGIPADSLTVLDGRHVSFSAASANTGDGEYHVAIAAGSVLDLQGTPVQSFSSSFSVAPSVACPPGASPEPEPCGDDSNSGCNSQPPAFSTIACGETVCGTAWADNGLQDRDAYMFTLTSTTRVAWTVQAAFPAIISLEDGTPTGSGQCPPSWVDQYVVAAHQTGLLTRCLDPGTYWVTVRPNATASYPCGSGSNNYVVTFSCEPCDIQACCLPDGTCQQLDSFYCLNQGGVPQGPGAVCQGDLNGNGVDDLCEAAPPANDACANAQELPPLLPAVVAFDTTQATDDNPPACGLSQGKPYKNVWFKLMGTGRRITAETCGTAFDTTMAVYTGDCAGLVCVAGNDDACGYQSRVGWCSKEGTVYYITVGGYSAADYGAGQLSVSEGGLCDADLDLSCPPNALQESEPCTVQLNDGCNVQPPTFTDIACGNVVCASAWTTNILGTDNRDTDWYRVTVTETKQLVWRAVAEFPLRMVIIDAGSGNCVDYVELTNAHFAAAVEGRLTACVDPGEYWLLALPSVFTGYPCESEDRTYVAQLTCGPCGQPANDLCEGAEQILSVPGSAAFDTTDATTDDHAGCGVGQAPRRNVWLTVMGTGREMTAATTNSATAFNTMIEVFSNGCSPLVCVGGNDDAGGGLQSSVTWCSEAGATYLINVGGAGDQDAGPGVLDIYDGPPCQSEPEPTADLGDAPDSSNSSLLPMTAYPPGNPPGVPANFPTVFLAGSPPWGPKHLAPMGAVYLGPSVSGEDEADTGPDADGGINNLLPQSDIPDLDGADDGVQFPIRLPHCMPTTLNLTMTVVNPIVQVMYLNVWFDWNRDGDWDDSMLCSDGQIVPEWAVANDPVPLPGIGTWPVTTSVFRSWHPSTTAGQLWMRVTLAEQPWNLGLGAGVGGDGPSTAYDYGETEDYYIDFIREPEGPGALDFGDAPASYPTLIASNGARHAVLSGGFNLGPLIDAEPDGLPHPAALGDDGSNLADEDGVTFVTPLRQARLACVDVLLNAPVPGLLDAWVDFDRDGKWDAGEQIFNGQLLAPGPNPGLCFTVPSGSAPGPTFARFRLSSNGALGPEGFAQDGEVEDYQRVIIPENPTVPVVITNIVVLPGSVVAIDWTAQAPYPYQLQHSTNLPGIPIQTWYSTAPLVVGPAGRQYDSNATDNARSYRIFVP